MKEKLLFRESFRVNRIRFFAHLINDKINSKRCYSSEEKHE